MRRCAGVGDRCEFAGWNLVAHQCHNEKPAICTSGDRYGLPGDVPRAKEAKKVRFSPRKTFDLIPFVGFNAGSLLRIPRAWLLSGIERLGSLKERKGYRESWATVERSEKKESILLKGVPGKIALCGY